MQGGKKPRFQLYYQRFFVAVNSSPVAASSSPVAVNSSYVAVNSINCHSLLTVQIVICC